jgi:hypothetical protein
VVYLEKNATNATDCPGGTPATPTAAPGFLCVFTETQEPVVSAFKAIENPAGEAGTASAHGAVVLFEGPSGVPSVHIHLIGTWAVTAP